MDTKNIKVEYFELVSSKGKLCKGINIYAVDKEGNTYLIKKLFLSEQELSIIKLSQK